MVLAWFLQGVCICVYILYFELWESLYEKLENKALDFFFFQTLETWLCLIYSWVPGFMQMFFHVLFLIFLLSTSVPTPFTNRHSNLLNIVFDMHISLKTALICASLLSLTVCLWHLSMLLYVCLGYDSNCYKIFQIFIGYILFMYSPSGCSRVVPTLFIYYPVGNYLWVCENILWGINEQEL